MTQFKNIIEQNDFGFAKQRAIIAQRYLILKTKKNSTDQIIRQFILMKVEKGRFNI